MHNSLLRTRRKNLKAGRVLSPCITVFSWLCICNAFSSHNDVVITAPVNHSIVSLSNKAGSFDGSTYLLNTGASRLINAQKYTE
jgi:hypothetical protein